MDLGTVKLILVFFRRWIVPARHGDVPNAYVKSEKKEHLDIYMKVLENMILDEKVLKVCEVTGHDARLGDEGNADTEDERITIHVPVEGHAGWHRGEVLEIMVFDRC